MCGGRAQHVACKNKLFWRRTADVAGAVWGRAGAECESAVLLRDAAGHLAADAAGLDAPGPPHRAGPAHPPLHPPHQDRPRCPASSRWVQKGALLGRVRYPASSRGVEGGALLGRTRYPAWQGEVSDRGFFALAGAAEVDRRRDERPRRARARAQGAAEPGRPHQHLQEGALIRVLSADAIRLCCGGCGSGRGRCFVVSRRARTCVCVECLVCGQIDACGCWTAGGWSACAFVVGLLTSVGGCVKQASDDLYAVLQIQNRIVGLPCPLVSPPGRRPDPEGAADADAGADADADVSSGFV
eukprot:1881841-Rhodomonas_salina.1